ncbi:MAG: DUF4340 domain-containing protein [Nannocystaceae bacterium]|nr:DUF4340 domain-containing protein [Nannocystaceae bacterium]
MIRPATAALGVAAIAAVVLVHHDPWQRAAAVGDYVAGRGGSERVLPQLPEGVPEGAAIELVRADGSRTRIAAHEHAAGLWVWADRELVGPADPEALDGLWSGLRATASLRAASIAATDAALGSGGRVRLELPGGPIELVLGAATPDGVGLYAALASADVGAAPWVLDRALADWIAQPATGWIARRPWVVEPAEIAAVRFADATLSRGPDGLWRAGAAGQGALLSSSAVDARLSRLLTARLDPFAASVADPGVAPWLQLDTLDGRTLPLWLRDGCEGLPGRVTLDRGLGRAGCVDARVADPWPLPGREHEERSWIEPRLVPWDYGRVLSIAQLRPQASTLRRQGGGWVIERAVSGGGTEVVAVPEPEVLRWYTALHDARLDTDAPRPAVSPTVELEVVSDSTARLRLSCAPDHGADDDAGDAMICARQGEPAFALRLPVAPDFTPESFAQRQLLALGSDELRALELQGPGLARQAAHLDLGVWRLDAPAHPEGDAVLDEDAIVQLGAALGGARALAWTEPPDEPPLRTIRLERTVRAGRGAEVGVTLWSDCRVRVDEGPTARVGEGTCEALARDLLVTTPLERVLEDATRLVVDGEDSRAFALVRRDGELVPEQGVVPGALQQALRGWPQWRARSIVAPAPVGTARWTLAIEPRTGEPWTLELGEGWARVRGADWGYVGE